MTSLRVALSFLTVLPVGPKRLPSDLSPARAWFPFVGLLLGGLVMGLDAGLRQGLPVGLSSAIVVGVLVAATSAMHLDGLIDSSDALFGGFDRERRLEILKDTHVGAFGVVTAGLALLLLWASIDSVQADIRRAALVLAPCLSRWSITVAMAAFPSARDEGLGKGFQTGAKGWHAGAAFAVALAASALLAGAAGAIMLAAATLLALALGRWMASLLGGLTGDSYGAINEVTMVAVLILAVGLRSAGPNLFAAPVPM